MTFWAWMFLLCFSLPAAAQQAVAVPLAQPEAVQPASANRQIKLDVVVTDKSGKVVPGLQQQDFSLLDNKQPRQILTFQAVERAAATPDPVVEVVLIVDEVNTGFERIAFERDEIKKFLLQNGGKLAQPVSMVFFSDNGTQVQKKPSTDGNAILADFDQNANSLRTIRRSNGIYGAEERLELSLKTLNGLAQVEAAKPGRKMLVWISPGWPILTGPRIDLTAREAQRVFSSVVAISAELRQARITLYSIDPLGTADLIGLRTTYYEEFLKGVAKPQNAQIGNLALQVIATQSGGLAIHGSNSVVAGIEQCVADAAAFYVLTLETAPAEHENEYHDLAVKIGTSGLTARTRTGYYAQP